MIAKAEPDQQASHPASPGHDEWLLDESLEETFPASDPISPAQSNTLERTRETRSASWSCTTDTVRVLSPRGLAYRAIHMDLRRDAIAN